MEETHMNFNMVGNKTVDSKGIAINCALRVHSMERPYLQWSCLGYGIRLDPMRVGEVERDLNLLDEKPALQPLHHDRSS